MLNNAPPTITEKVKQALAKDPRKTGLMSGLGIVMVLLWVRMASNGPAAATASFIRRSVAVITNQSMTSQKPPSSNPVLEWLAQPRRPLERNLFAIHLEYFARAGSAESANNSAEDPAKSDTDATDQDRQKQILLENLQNQAARLKLQATVLGAAPSALVNGELVKEGDTIAGFRVCKIQARKIVVEQDGVVLEIEMP